MAKAKKKSANRAARLGAGDWIKAGLMTLSRKGVANVRIERLANDLKVTKGSFYWHFVDREALLDAMLVSWRNQSLGLFEKFSKRLPNEPRELLVAVLRAPQTTSDAAEGVQIELAIRLWARRDERVNRLLQEMERLRQSNYTDLMKACGVPTARASALAVLLRSVLFTLWTMDTRNTSERDSLIETTSAIIESHARR